MKVVVDMDGVLCDWRGGVLAEFEKQGLTILPPSYWTTRRIEKWVIPAEERRAAGIVEVLMLKPGFWESLEPIHRAEEAFTMLHHLLEDDLYVGTVPWWSSPTCAYEKVQWLRKHFPFFDIYKHVIMAHPKWLVNADLLIDDSAEQILPWAATGRDAIVFDYQYNKEVKENGRRIFRAYSWTDIEVMVFRLCNDERYRRDKK